MLTHLPPEMIIHRLTGDCPKGLLTAPDWNPKKNEILQMIRDRMSEQGLRQGIFYETDQSLQKEGE
jgi:radical SAM superfamily enzyme